MKLKFKILLIALIIIIISSSVYLIIIHNKEKQNIINLDFSYEKFIPADISILIRFEDANSIWQNFKDTNFYPQLKIFLGWLWNEMPSETLSFSNDVKDIQEKVGFNLDEKNIFSIFGKKVFIAFWLQNDDDKKILIMTELDNNSLFSDKIKKLIERKIGVEEYKNITIDIFGENKYWTVINNQLLISDDIGTIRKVIDLISNFSNDSIFNNLEFNNYISKTIYQNYIYIRPDKIKTKNYSSFGKQINSVLLSLNIKKGILVKSFIFLKNLQAKETLKKIKSTGFAPKDALVYIAGDFAIPYLTSKSAIERIVIGKESGYILIPSKDNNAVIIFCEVKNKKLFLKGFEKFVKPDNDIFNYNLPLLGSIQFKYFFVKNYFVVCSPPDFSENIKELLSKKENLLVNTDDFRRLEIPQKNNGIFYINFSDLFFRLTKKNYLNFLKPSGGYTNITQSGSESTYYIPMADLPSQQWAEMLSELQKLASKRIVIERQRITHKNLLYIREAINIYNAKTNRYPRKINSLIEEYLDEIPQELITKSNNVTNKIDGTGGWFYRNGKIKVNVFGTAYSGNYYTQW